MAGVTGLYIYPIKSCRGMSLMRTRCGAAGFPFDREWVLRAASGKALTQRDVARMALISAEPGDGGGLTLSYAGDQDRAPLVVSSVAERKRMTTDVWGAETAGLDEGDEAAAWISSILEEDVRLLRRDFTDPRLTKIAKPNGEPAPLSFFDSMPLLVVSEESLEDLNQRVGGGEENRIPMDRFRASIIIRGLGAFAEDEAKTLRVGGVTMHRGKPCARCVVTTIDQSTARHKGPEPLRTLSKYRQVGEKVMFGTYFMPDADGEIAVGDTVEVIA